MELEHYKFKRGETDVVYDDAVAQTIMLKLGVWDQFEKDSPLTITMCVSEDHPTHWCLCALHRHNPDPSENGFQIIGYPKESVTLPQVYQLMRQYLASASDVTMDVFEPKPWD